MKMNQKNLDIRWEQRFNNYVKALTQLEKSVDYIVHHLLKHEEADADRELEEVLSNLIRQGLIQSFEYTHEVAWKLIKDYAEYQGNTSVSGSRDAAREAFGMGLISKGDVWMEMIKSRNETSHTYNEETAEGIYRKIIEEYLPAFVELKMKLEELRSGLQGDIFAQ
jgi:nucleotidyltransferase substrate binding protein (TIGR01987 family)